MNTQYCRPCGDEHDDEGFYAPALHRAGLRVVMDHAMGTPTEYRVTDYNPARPMGHAHLRVKQPGRLRATSAQSIPTPLLRLVPSSVTERGTGGRLPDCCTDCGWQYPLSIVIEALLDRMTVDLNPTHRCVVREWVRMSTAQEQAWHNGYFTPTYVRETPHGVEYVV